MIPFLLAVAHAADADFSSVSTVQVRPDQLGVPFVSAWEDVAAGVVFGSHRAEGYGEVAWPAGVDGGVVPELFVLALDGHLGTVDWSVGRQRLDLPTFSRLLDGARLGWSPHGMVRVEAWAGQVRHVAWDAIDSGAPVGRLDVGLEGREFSVRAGGWAEVAEAPRLHSELWFRWHAPSRPWSPDFRLLAGGGPGDTGAILERGRVELTLRPAGGVRAMAFAEHRHAPAAETRLGASVLDELAPQGVDRAGGGVGWSDTHRNQLWVEGSIQTWRAEDAGGERLVGASATLSWRPACGAEAWCLVPTWRAGTGPGGVYDAWGATVHLPLPEVVGLEFHGMVVPYRKPHEPWDTTLVGGGSVDVRPAGSFVSLAVGGEVARDVVLPLDARGWFRLRLAAR